MRRVRLLVVTVFAALGVFAPVAESTDYFLEVNGVPGEGNDAKLVKAIKVVSFSWGAQRDAPATGGGGQTGRPNLRELSIAKNLDVTSPQLFRKMLQGAAIPHMELIARKSGATQAIFFKMCFQQVFVTSINQSGSGGDDVPTESVSFFYNTVTEQYTRQNPDGSLGTSVFAGWNATTGALTSAYPTTCGY